MKQVAKSRTRRNQTHIRKAPLVRILLALALVSAVMIFVFCGDNAIQAEESTTACKQYTSITIYPGDSLWSIAVEHADGHYSSTQEYIDEVKQINHLTSDTINAFEHLIVPYYVG